MPLATYNKLFERSSWWDRAVVGRTARGRRRRHRHHDDSVTERTRDRRAEAPGATRGTILWQFLVEAVTPTALARQSVYGGVAVAITVRTYGRRSPRRRLHPPSFALAASALTGVLFGRCRPSAPRGSIRSRRFATSSPVHHG
jgi:hypothetical protein